MGATVSQTYKARQQIINNVLQISNEKCVNTCVNLTENDITIISNSTISGNVDFSQKCTIQGVSCVLQSYLDSNIENITNSISQQEQMVETDILSIDFGKYSETVNVQQQIANNISQMSSEACKTSVSNDQEHNLIVLTGDTIGGDFTKAQNGIITNSSCVLNNVVSQQITNEESSKSTQSITKGSVLLFAIQAIIAVAILIAALVVTVVLLKSVTRIATKGKSGNEKKETTTVTYTDPRNSGVSRYVPAYNKMSQSTQQSAPKYNMPEFPAPLLNPSLMRFM